MFYYFLERVGDLMIRFTGLTIVAIIVVLASTWIIKRSITKMMLRLLIAATIAGLILGYGVFIEPFWIQIKQQEIVLPDYNGDQLTIILISDTHVGKFSNTKVLKQAIEKINNIDAEYVLILGDLMDGDPAHLGEIEVLKNLKNKNVFFVYGNHDYEYNQGERLVKGLEEKLKGMGVTILDNETVQLDDTVYLSGIPDIWSVGYDLDFLKNVAPSHTHILMSHNPDVVMRIAEDPDLYKNIDLVVSGHTHGGEIRLPFVGPLSALPTDLPRKYDKGYFDYEGIPLYITSGLSNVGIRTKYFNRPEIIILEIR